MKNMAVLLYLFLDESEVLFMAVVKLDENFNTRVYKFGYDDWSVDGDKLPRIGIAGKDNLITIKGCSQNSVAIGTDGTMKILKGETNEWVNYSRGSSGGGSGSSEPVWETL